MSVLVDTNILVRLSQAGHPLQTECQLALSRLLQRGDQSVLCTQAAIEFWSVATRPQTANGLGLDPSQAEARLQDFETLLVWLPEPPDIGSRWRGIVNRYGIRGRQAHDARLVAFMQSTGLTELLTLNAADFARYDGIKCVHPSDFR